MRLKGPVGVFVDFVLVVTFVVIGFVANGCSSPPRPPEEIRAVTRTVGLWSGRGTTTVGDVPSETGRLRIHWQTTNESPAGAGAFKLTLRSAISGRTIGIVADHQGVGAGTAEFDDGPRTYDFLVESANVDWSFRVEETSGEFGAATPRAAPANP
jgi:hypothetical protein